MPWKLVDLMSQRKELVEKLLLPGAKVDNICEEYGVSRKTAYKWLVRYKEGNLEALKDKSKVPKNSPSKVKDDIEKRIIQAHKEYPYWGPRKLRNLLINESALESYPAPSTFARILKRNDCEVIKNFKSKPATTRFERSTPNDLWQIDFKGSFMTDAHRCYPLTIIDDFSRYSINLKACQNEQCDTVKSALIACFKEFGLPNQINADNGNPWGSSGANGNTRLIIWLAKCGVRVSHSAPYHPQTNGKDERFHRTLKLEVLHEKKYNSCHDIQDAFDEWRHIYNYIRPHHALGGKPPCSRYNVSHREFTGKLQEPEYEEGSIVRKVHKSVGTFRLKGKKYYAGKGLSGEYIAIKETAEADVYSLFFMDTFIKKFNINSGV